MKLSTLRAAERAAYKLMTTFEKERKTDAEAQRLYDAASKLWQERHAAFKAADIAQAEKRDKGEVLFTVFVPNRNGWREVVRTPNRLITTHKWRDSSPAGHHASASYTEVCSKLYSPAWHFNFYMHVADKEFAEVVA